MKWLPLKVFILNEINIFTKIISFLAFLYESYFLEKIAEESLLILNKTFCYEVFSV